MGTAKIVQLFAKRLSPAYCIIAVLISFIAAHCSPLSGAPQVYCGPNCTYMLLRLCGHDLCADDLRKITERYANNMSLADIRDSCNQFGQEVSIRKILPSEIRNITFPAILHFKNFSGEGLGHYWVVVNKTEDGKLCCIDGTSAERFFPSYERVEKHELLSGYVILPTPKDRKYIYVLGGAAVGIIGYSLVRLKLR